MTTVGEETNRPGSRERASGCDRADEGREESPSGRGGSYGWLTGDPPPEGLQASKKPKLRQQEE